jgi:hypothetical protein
MDMYIEQSFFDDAIGPDRVKRALAPYRAWVDSRPEPIRSCCVELLGSEVAHSNLVNLPFLLSEPFGLDPDEAVISQFVAGNAFMLTYFLASDRLVDAPECAHRFTILIATEVHAQMLAWYEKAARHQGAGIWAELVTDHVHGVLQEEDHHACCRRGEPGLDAAGYESAIVLKNRYGMAAIPLLALTTQRFGPEPVLREVYDHISIEIEFADDLKDWREDLSAGRFTPVIQALQRAAGSLDPDSLDRAFLSSGAIPDVLEIIGTHLRDAAGNLESVPFTCGLLRTWIDRHREANERLKKRFLDRQVRFALSRAVRQSEPARAAGNVAPKPLRQ